MSSSSNGALLEVTDLVKHFPIKSGVLIDREVGMRQVDPGAVGSPAAQANLGFGALPRHRAHRAGAA